MELLRRLRPFFLAAMAFLPLGRDNLALAQSPDPPLVVNYSKAGYGGQNQNWTITQTPNGFMYFANSAGLLEFDGSKWTVFPLPEKQIVRSVASDETGKIFTGAFGEFGYWQYSAAGGIEYTSLSRESLREDIGSEEIWKILILPGRVLFHSFSTIYEYDYEKVQTVRPPGNIMLLHTINRRVLVPVIQQGLFEKTDQGAFRLLAGSERLADLRVKAIIPLSSGFLVGTENNGLFHFDGWQWREWKNEADEQLRTATINRGIRLRNGRLALGTILDGIFILDESGKLISHINQNNGLQNNTVLSLFEDRDGNLWAGLDKGIDLICTNFPLTHYQDKTGLTGTTYAAVIHDQRFYLGTNQGLFVKPWPSTQEFRLVPGTQGQVWDLQVLDGQLLCGHNSGTLSITGDKAVPLSEITGGWYMIRDPEQEGRLLQATYTGLIVFTRDDMGRWQFSHRIAGLSEPVRKIIFDREGALWALHPYRGLYRLELSAARDSILSIRPIGRAEGLPSEYRLSMEWIDNQLLIQSDTAFFRWVPETQRLAPVDKVAGLPLAAGIYQLLAGQKEEWFRVYLDQVVWFRGAAALGSFPLALVPTYERILTWSDSSYLFCLENGYAVLDRLNPGLPAGEVSPVIRRVRVQTGENRKAGQLPVNENTPATLGATSNSLRFEYASPHYFRPPQFRYRLLGLSPEWSAWSAQAEREFISLPPGKYTFEVQTNGSEKTALFSFTIRPHWYQTTWMKLLLVLLAFALAALLMHWHHYRLAHQRRRMEIERERQLQQQRIRTRNEQLQAEVISKSKELSNSTFNLIRKNETLLHIKEELEGIKKDLGNRWPDKYHQHLIHLINHHLSNEQDWEVFESNFSQVHEAFLRKLKNDFPALTPGDLKLAAYLKMNLSSKEIAPLLNISVRGVENKRYRLRQKLELDSDDNLADFLMGY